MKKLKLFIILCLITNFTFAQDIIYYDSNWAVTDKQNHEYYRIQTQEGSKWLVKDYYKNGQLQMEGEYSSLNPDIKEGLFYWYYKDGTWEHFGSYSNDLRDGGHMFVRENGKSLRLENYTDGILNGAYKEYNTVGICTLETVNIYGKKYGLTKVYYDDGTLHSSGKVEDGDKIGEWKYYDKSGNFTQIVDHKTDFFFSEAMLYLKLPSSNWHLETKTKEGDYEIYNFERKPIINKAGNEEIPGIIVYFEDATNYNQNVELFANEKKIPFIQIGVNASLVKAYTVGGISSFHDKMIFYKGNLSDGGTDYLIYMVYFITKDNVGVQIYMSMPKELAVDYEREFKSCIQSLDEM
jgi:antitoxin component YwqK of YwqJK toxin-antitoxin module